jgi:hypothetical protein
MVEGSVELLSCLRFEAMETVSIDLAQGGRLISVAGRI